MENVRILKATIENIDDIMNIQKESDCYLISYENLKNDLSNSNCNYLIYYINDFPIAFIGSSYIFSDMDLLYVLVLPNYRNKQIATKLIYEIEEFCYKNNISRILLEVRSKNNIAIKFYEKQNFKKINIRKNYYNNDNALIYEKKLIIKNTD